MIYFNNAATSWPKFKTTEKVISDAIKNGRVYCGRDTADFSHIEAELFSLRQNLSEHFLHAKAPHEICFASSSTLALNELIMGRVLWLKHRGVNLENGVILCSDREHNSVMRPLAYLKERFGIDFVTVPLHNGMVSIPEVTKIIDEIRKKSQLIFFAVFSHVSNVTGDSLNAEELGLVLKQKNIPFLLDTTQSIGITPINVEQMFVSATAFAGHKGLNGPQGTGAFYVRHGFNIEPILYGGTGHASSMVSPPIAYPDSFEVGTPPVHDLLGLADSVKTILEMNGRYARQILSVTQYCQDKFAIIKGIHIYGRPKKESSILSFVIRDTNPSVLAQYLWNTAKINARAGILCSPMGLKAIGQESVLRFSFGYFNTFDEVDKAAKVVTKFGKEKGTVFL